MVSLSAQAEAIKSVNSKIALVERYLRRNKRVSTSKVSKLQELLAQLDFDILSKSGLQELYRINDVYDREAQLLLEQP